jgi:hypothetical protein
MSNGSNGSLYSHRSREYSLYIQSQLDGTLIPGAFRNKQRETEIHDISSYTIISMVMGQSSLQGLFS